MVKDSPVAVRATLADCFVHLSEVQYSVPASSERH